MPANLENSAVATALEKVSFHFNLKERQCQRMLKLLHNCTHVTCWQSNTQNSPARLQKYVNHEFPDVQAGFRKRRGTRDQIANIRWIIKKAKEFHINIYFCFIHFTAGDRFRLYFCQRFSLRYAELITGEFLLHYGR